MNAHLEKERSKLVRTRRGCPAPCTRGHSRTPFPPSHRASLFSAQQMKPVIFFAPTHYQITGYMFLVFYLPSFPFTIKSRLTPQILVVHCHTCPPLLPQAAALVSPFLVLSPVTLRSILRLPSEGLWLLCHTHSLLWDEAKSCWESLSFLFNLNTSCNMARDMNGGLNPTKHFICCKTGVNLGIYRNKRNNWKI